MKSLTPEFKKSILFSFFEYLVVLVPIAIYVFLEAVHKHDLYFFFQSPEWAIGIIFLSFISINKYVQTCYKSYKSALQESLNIYSIFNIIIIVFATLNAVWSIEKDTNILQTCRLILFIFASLIFFIFMTNSKLIRND